MTKIQSDPRRATMAGDMQLLFCLLAETLNPLIGEVTHPEECGSDKGGFMAAHVCASIKASVFCF